MPIDFEHHKFPVVILIIVILLAVFVVAKTGFKIPIYNSNQAYNTPAPSAVPQGSSGLGADIYDNNSNPVNDIPQTNPFSQNSNPISDAYQNPF